ncbi:FIG4 phosphoinositide 5-phosphatase [Carabus blaptoides fortunei]
MDKSNVIFHPIISSIQKIALYETKTKYFLVGSNNTETRFRVLKIDRTEPRELFILDDKVEYTRDEIKSLLSMIDTDNRQKSSYSGFGIVGFIRFLEGYYIILINKRRKVAVVGYHTIYKIQDTCMIYIPNDTVRILHQDEQRYVKMFQSIDLSSNFYFSYSYDLTHSLQHNLCPPRHVGSPTIIDDATALLTASIFPDKPTNVTANMPVEDYGIRTKPHRKFVWNNYLLSPVEDKLHPDWLLYVTHGFIDQTNVSIFGRSVYITLIARRSSKYAGTRFLKRGANFQGDVANEVETEQMVHDSGVSSLTHGRFTSFVQMRGSIPGHWSQDISKMVPKPAISIDLNDPFAETAGAHFNELLKRYGTPIIILNLVKKREKKKHESFLSKEIRNSVRYLNQFLPPQHVIQYNTFDMARINHKKEAKVMERLASIADTAISKTGICQSQSPYFAQKPGTILGQDNDAINVGRLQAGIIRTNCVDCLDRTNTAQFAIGKCALGYQLCALGMLDFPKLEFDTDCVRMLESLYEDHGDTLALQYGGSHLVHRVKTYRKTAPWTSQGNDIMQTCRRYYSNTFSDAEKQNAHNLFLGLFIPQDNKPAIWENMNDYYLHNFPVFRYLQDNCLPLTQWWEPNVLRCLPYAYNDVTKSCSEIIKLESKEIEMIDAYTDYHRPDLLSEMSDMYAYKISNSIRDFMPNCTMNYSPFVVRVGHGRRRAETTRKGETVKNPCLTGQSSTGSMNSSEASYTSDDECNGNIADSQISGSKDSESATVTFESWFPTMRQVYGTEPETPKKADILLYKKYVLVGHKANVSVHIIKWPTEKKKQHIYSCLFLQTFVVNTLCEIKPQCKFS